MAWPIFFFFKRRKKKSVEARKKGVSTEAKSLTGAENRRMSWWEELGAIGDGGGARPQGVGEVGLEVAAKRGRCFFFGFGGFFGHTAPLVGSLFPDQGLKPHPQQ